MSAGGGEFGGRGGSQDFDLNLAPIIDCFVVLIAFMLVSASFLAIGIFDAGVAAGGVENDTTKPPPVAVNVMVEPGGALKVKLSGKSDRTVTLKAVAGTRAPAASADPKAPAKPDRDYAGLQTQLDQIKKQWPKTNVVTVTASDTVEYEDVIRTMEAVRKSIPDVLLGGF